MKRTVLLLFAFVAFTAELHSHEWYDYDCCDNRDCYPLPEDAVLEELPNGSWSAAWISPKSGKLIKGIVSPQNVRDTQNHQLHGCETSYGDPRCLYIHRGT
jgi:hypothetical protein